MPASKKRAGKRSILAATIVLLSGILALVLTGLHASQGSRGTPIAPVGAASSAGETEQKVICTLLIQG